MMGNFYRCIEKIQKLKYIIFFISAFTFSQNSSLYITDGAIVSGFETSSFSFISSKRITQNQIFVKNNTIFYNYNLSLNSYELINLKDKKDNFYKSNLTKKKPIVTLANKKIDANLFKNLPFSAPFSMFSKNRTINAVISNIYQYKNNAKNIILISTFRNSLFAILKKSNRFTVAYNFTKKSYLLVSYYTSRPPPLII